jgi:hypothetical protein
MPQTALYEFSPALAPELRTYIAPISPFAVRTRFSARSREPHAMHLNVGRRWAVGQPPIRRSSRRGGVKLSGTSRSAPQWPQRIKTGGWCHAANVPCVRYETNAAPAATSWAFASATAT